MTLAVDPGGVEINAIEVDGALDDGFNGIFMPLLFDSMLFGALTALLDGLATGVADIFCVCPVPDVFGVSAVPDTFLVPAGRTVC